MASFPCETCKNPCLDDLGFLSGFEQKQKLELMAKVKQHRLVKGGSLFHEGDPVAALFVVHEGKVKLSTWDSEGREQIVGIFGNGDAIWESLFLEDSAYPYSAVAVSDVSYCEFPKNEFEKAVADTPTALHLIALLSRKLHDANERNLILSTNNPEKRVAKFFLYRRQRSQEAVLRFRLDDIAASVSLRPETVSRKLKELIRLDCLVKVSQSGFRITNLGRLREIAES